MSKQVRELFNYMHKEKSQVNKYLHIYSFSKQATMSNKEPAPLELPDELV